MLLFKIILFGGSVSFIVLSEVGVIIFKVFLVKFGFLVIMGFNWGSSLIVISVEEVKYEVSVEVNLGDEVYVYQVVGECENFDGIKYIFKIGRYEIRGKNGEKMEIFEIFFEEGVKLV